MREGAKTEVDRRLQAALEGLASCNTAAPSSASSAGPPPPPPQQQPAETPTLERLLALNPLAAFQDDLLRLYVKIYIHRRNRYGLDTQPHRKKRKNPSSH